MSCLITGVGLEGYAPYDATMEEAFQIARATDLVTQIAMTKDTVWIRNDHGHPWILMFVMVDGQVMGINDHSKAVHCRPVHFKEMVEPSIVDDYGLTDNEHEDPRFTDTFDEKSGGNPFWTIGEVTIDGSLMSRLCGDPVGVMLDIGDGPRMGVYAPARITLKELFDHATGFPEAKDAGMIVRLFGHMLFMRFGWDDEFRLLAFVRQGVTMACPSPDKVIRVSVAKVEAIGQPLGVFP